MYQWEKGISLSFFQNEQGECVGGDKVVLDKVRSYGFDCVELSFSHDDYFKKYRFTEGDNAEQLFQYCESIGLKIWSIHLPFSDCWRQQVGRIFRWLSFIQALSQLRKKREISGFPMQKRI